MLTNEEKRILEKTSRKEYNEILEILQYIPLRDYLKIPNEKISFFIENKDENYQFHFEKSKPINEQNISKKTYIIFLQLYIDYIATDFEKTKIQDILKLNRKKHEKEIKVGEEMFKRSTTTSKVEAEELIVYKKKSNFFIRCYNKILNIIKKGKTGEQIEK